MTKMTKKINKTKKKKKTQMLEMGKELSYRQIKDFNSHNFMPIN